MIIHWKNLAGSHFIVLQPTEPWYMYCTVDENDSPYIQLRVNGKDHPVFVGAELSILLPFLPPVAYHAYCAAIVDEVCDHIRDGCPEYLNLTDCIASVLEMPYPPDAD